MNPYVDRERQLQYYRDREKVRLRDPEYRARHRVYGRRSYEKYKSQRKEKSRRYQRSLRQIWGCSPGTQKGYLFDTKPSESAALRLLESLGFLETRSLTVFRKSFPFDVVATKEGRKALIEVTTNTMHINNQRFELAALLGLDFYVLFMRPTLDGYYLLKPSRPKFGYHIPYSIIKRREWNGIP